MGSLGWRVNFDFNCYGLHLQPPFITSQVINYTFQVRGPKLFVTTNLGRTFLPHCALYAESKAHLNS